MTIQDRMRAFDDACAIRAGYRQDVRKALETTLGEKVSPKVVRDLYAMGALPNCFPVPATLDIADTSIGYIDLSHCPICVENYMDQLWDDYYRSL